jgi:hypothetical protein
MPAPRPEADLKRFLERCAPNVRAVANDALARLRRRLPGAVKMVYDNYNALVIGFSPTDRPSDALFSIALYPRWVNLFFLTGADLDDPEGLLQGNGRIVRSIRLTTADVVDAPGVRALMAQAIRKSGTPYPRRGGRLEIRAVSPNKRRRR